MTYHKDYEAIEKITEMAAKGMSSKEIGQAIGKTAKAQPFEVVHHKDNNPQNNSIDNLELFATNAEHLKKTLKGRVPNWSEEGFANMCKPRPQYSRKPKT